MRHNIQRRLPHSAPEGLDCSLRILRTAEGGKSGFDDIEYRWPHADWIAYFVRLALSRLKPLRTILGNDGYKLIFPVGTGGDGNGCLH